MPKAFFSKLQSSEAHVNKCCALLCNMPLLEARSGQGIYFLPHLLSTLHTVSSTVKVLKVYLLNEKDFSPKTYD